MQAPYQHTQMPYYMCSVKCGAVVAAERCVIFGERALAERTNFYTISNSQH